MPQRWRPQLPRRAVKDTGSTGGVSAIDAILHPKNVTAHRVTGLMPKRSISPANSPHGSDSVTALGPSIDWWIMKGAIRPVGYVGGWGLVNGMDATFGWDRD
jgi:hypothetical protein